MGWGISIITDTPIPVEEAEEIVNTLPENLRTRIMGGKGISRQSWGWGALVDIALPEKNRWAISGAHFSIQHATSYVEALAAGLRAHGFSVMRVDYPEGMFRPKDFAPAVPPVDWTRRFNFNDTVTVTLTDLGVSVYRKARPHNPALDGKQVSLQLWELAHIFGPHLGNGFPDVFVGTWFDLYRMVKPDGQ